jgi:hypothetical protein
MIGCRYCDEFKEEWGKLENLVKTDSRLRKNNITVKTIAVESRQLDESGLAEIEKNTGIKVVPTINKQDFEGFPTVKIEVGKEEYNYSGKRKAEDIILFILSKAVGSQDGGSKVDYRKKYKKWKAYSAELLKKYKKLKNLKK